ncbi:MAG TPA: hypothetical protein VFW24_09455 [Acidimicrobiales bacterium]|nr:hypothetical protein [Acidimicrobiales bacterium]
MPTFGTNGVVVDTSSGANTAAGVALDAKSGELVAVGSAAGPNFAAARFTASGRIDRAFGGGTVVTSFPGTSGSEAEAVATYPSGTPLSGYALVVGTAFLSSGGREMALARYTPSGQLDPSFGSGGRVTEQVLPQAGAAEDDELDSVAVGAFGSVVVAGYSLGANPAAPSERAIAVLRLNSTGALDTSFGTGGVATVPVGQSQDPAAGVALDSSGRPVVVGSAVDNNKKASDVLVARLGTGGALDPSFGSGGIATVAVGAGDDFGYGLTVQSDGGIVVSGSTFDSNKSTSDGVVLRLTATGALDTGFGSGGKVVETGADAFRAVAVESPGGNVLAAGYVTGAHGVRSVAVERLHSSGARDGSFGTNGLSVTTPNGGSSAAGSVVLDPAGVSDSNVVVAGPLSSGSATGLGLEELVGGGAPLPPATPPPAVYPDTTGYHLVARDGGVFAYGNAGFYGSAGAIHLSKPIVGMAATPDARGYWLVASDGGVFTYGDARYFGSAGAIHLSKPIVGMAATPDGKGYWLVASDGGIFTYGDAGYFGSAGAIHLSWSIASMAPTPDGKGYWLVALDGGIFTYGDAHYFGSTGGMHLSHLIAGMAPTADGKGYWLVGSDGGVFTYGDAGFHGSAGALRLVQPIVGMTPSPSGAGYLLAARDGGIFTYGDAVYEGSAGGTNLTAPIVGMAP